MELLRLTLPALRRLLGLHAHYYGRIYRRETVCYQTCYECGKERRVRVELVPEGVE
jgi:hypothetical protein